MSTKGLQKHLFLSINEGNLQDIKDILLKNPLLVNEAMTTVTANSLKDTKVGYFPLTIALFSKNLEVVKLLVEQGADINQCYDIAYLDNAEEAHFTIFKIILHDLFYTNFYSDNFKIENHEECFDILKFLLSRKEFDISRHESKNHTIIDTYLNGLELNGSEGVANKNRIILASKVIKTIEDHGIELNTKCLENENKLQIILESYYYKQDLNFELGTENIPYTLESQLLGEEHILNHDEEI